MKKVGWMIVALATIWAQEDIIKKPYKKVPTLKDEGKRTLMTITIPRMLSYQGKLTDTLGNPIPDGNYQLTFRLYTQPTGGSPFWTETQTVYVKKGLFSVLLGTNIPIPSIPDTGNLYLSLQVESNPELTPRLRIVSSAYSFLCERSANSDLLQGKDTVAFDSRYVNENQTNSITSSMIVNGTILGEDINQMGASIGQVLKWTGTNWAPGSDSGIDGWSLTGNVISGTEFLGTINPQPLRFFTNNTECMRIETNGNVGIGTTQPGAKLHIASIGEVLRIMPNTMVNGQYTSIIFRDPDNSTGPMEIRYTDAPPPHLAILGGNLGIGTPTPSTKLEVKLGSGEYIKATGDYNGYTAIGRVPYYGYPQANAADAIYATPNFHLTSAGELSLLYNTNLKILTGTPGNATERIRITNTGNMGIGTTNPGNILTIVQNSSTDPIADAWTVYSSRRWKTNIKPIENALDKVKRLKGVYFDWKADGKHDIGMIAEEVGEVIPEVVVYEENGKDAKSLDYSRLVALLIEAIKEQQQKIEKLEKEIEEMKNLLNQRRKNERDF